MYRDKFNIVLMVILLNAILAGCENGGESVDLPSVTHESNVMVEETSEEIFVYVNGAVKNPGVYCVNRNTRIYQVIDMAGGMTGKAQKDCLNLAEKVQDGQEIKVLSKKQFKKQNSGSSDEGTKEERAELKDISENTSEAGMVNINSATAEQLTSLPGIGDTKAAAIVAYRDENGDFSSIEDIKKVSGIGDAIFANIESKITVN